MSLFGLHTCVSSDIHVTDRTSEITKPTGSDQQQLSDKMTYLYNSDNRADVKVYHTGKKKNAQNEVDENTHN
jgi:hypothetical protein